MFERKHLIPKNLPWIYLEEDGTKYENFKIFATPWQPFFYEWAFNLYEEDLKIRYDQIPLDTSILITHSPPFGFGDSVPRKVTNENEEFWPEPERVGSPSLLERIKLMNDLKLHVFGHIHSGFGKYDLDGKILANVSFVNEKYQPTHSIMEFEL